MATTSDVSLSPAEHIESIRAEFRGLPGRARESLQSALDHLGAKLYSRKAHFLFELIQNADDNEYPPAVEPTLEFHLLSTDPTGTPDAEGCLVVANNEDGFQREHVDAICRLGKTTKRKAAGYIGEKGVGFKSVFQVSARPHILSNGYAFYFDEKAADATVGYICPTWIERPPDFLDSWTTRIFLPLKKGELSKLGDDLEEIHPSTLLFLQKIKRLKATFDGAPLQELMLETHTRSSGPLALVRLQAATRSPMHYWVYRHVARRPEWLDEPEREGVHESVITIAHPVDERGEEEGRVFVFLPTELRSGFPFITNADFLTTPSRESILFDRPWNRWLRDELSIALAEALLALARLAEDSSDAGPGEPRPGPALAYLLVPDPGRVRERDFFLSVWEEARDLLQGETFVRSATQDPVHHQLRRPPEVLRGGDEIRTLLRPDGDPSPALGSTLHLTHESLDGVGKALDRLGVRELSLKDLIPALEGPWVARRSPSWFVALYAYFASRKWKPPQDVPLIPTTSGLACATEVVYLASARQDPLPAALAERFRLRVMTAELASALGESPTALKWLREHCRVSELSPREVIVNSILPEISIHDSEGLILEATRYIARHLESLSDHDKEMVTKGLRRIFTSSEAGGEAKTLVLPAGLDAEGWQAVFVDPEDRSHLTVLSDDYLAVPEEERPRVLDLLRACGATDTPPPRRTETKRGEPGQNGFEEGFAKMAGTSRRPITVTNYRPPRWLWRLKEGADPQSALPNIRALLRWLQRWEARRPRYGTGDHLEWERAHAKRFYYTWHSKWYPSEFSFVLVMQPWVPSTRGLQPPGAVFLKSEEVRGLFGEDVPYLTHVEEFAGVLERYGLNRSATPATAFEFLRKSSRAGTSLSRETAERLYRLVAVSDRHLDPASNDALVYVPNATPQWRRAAEVTWTDTSVALGDRFPSIEKIYPRLRDFFVTHWHVPEDAPDDAYLDAWRGLPTRGYPPERVEAALERIYLRLMPVAREKVTAFRDLPIWTQDKVFSDRPVYVPDDPDLRSRFLNSVRYAWRPEKRAFDDFAELYDALGVRWLSRSVRRTVVQIEPAPDGQPRLLTPGARRMLAYDLWSRWAECWDKHEEGVVALLRLQEVPFRRLVVRYELAVEDADPTTGRFSGGGGEAAVEDADLITCTDRDRLLVAAHADIEEVRQAASVLLATEVLGSNDRDVENAVFRALTVKDEWASKEIRRKRLRRPPDDLLRAAGQMDLPLVPEDTETVPPGRATEPGDAGEPIGEVRPDTATETLALPTVSETTLPGAETGTESHATDDTVEGSGAPGIRWPGQAGAPSSVSAAGPRQVAGDGLAEPVLEEPAAAEIGGATGTSRPAKPSFSFAKWIIGLQRDGAPQRDVERPVSAGGPRTVRAADEDLERARGIPAVSRTELRVRREQVLTEVAAELRERARSMLRADYQGCQICGRTFVQTNGDLDIVAVQWRPVISESGDLHYGNLLGVCAWHAALLQRGRFTFLDGDSRPFPHEAAFVAFVRAGGCSEETPNGDVLSCLPLRFHNVTEPGETETRDHDTYLRYCQPHWTYFRRLLEEDHPR